MDKALQIVEFREQGIEPQDITVLTGVPLPEVLETLAIAVIDETGAKGIPLESMLDFAKKGLKDTQIAKLLGCSRANVSARLGPYKEDIKALEAYKDHKADIFNLKQRELLSALTTSRIKEMSGLQIVTAIGILNDKIRAETGKDFKVALNLSKVIHEIHSMPGGAGISETIDLENLENVEQPDATERDVTPPDETGGAPGG